MNDEPWILGTVEVVVTVRGMDPLWASYVPPMVLYGHPMDLHNRNFYEPPYGHPVAHAVNRSGHTE